LEKWRFSKDNQGAKSAILRAELLLGPSRRLSSIAVNEGAQKANFLQENQCPVLSKIRLTEIKAEKGKRRLH